MATILVADDEPDILDMLTDMLQMHGHEVIGVGDGQRALERIDQRVPDLVPQLNGLEVCRRVRAAGRTAAVPVILVTALARDVDIEKGYAAGADNYICKPLRLKHFLNSVNAALHR